MNVYTFSACTLCFKNYERVNGIKDLEELIKPGLLGGEGDQRRTEFDIKNSQIYYNEIPVDIVFLGDSITHFWEVEEYFKEYGTIVNRGISGEVAHLAEKRFKADVVQLSPRICVMMVGINNTWILDECKTEQERIQLENKIMELYTTSYRSILTQAKQAGIKMLFCSITPIHHQPEFRKHFIVRTNRLIQSLCQEYEITYVDYYSKMVSDDGITMEETLSWDGVHPHVRGYNIMKTVLTPYLNKIKGGI